MSEIDSKNIFSQLGLNKPVNSDAKANDELGQAEFLELMTAQLRYQDPLKPMENGDFLGQMAQFGTVSVWRRTARPSWTSAARALAPMRTWSRKRRS